MKRSLFENIVSRVADVYRIGSDIIFDRDAGTQAKRARQMVWWLSNDRQIELFEISEYTEKYGLKMSKSTVLHGIKSFQKRMDSDDDILKIVNQIKIQL